MHPLTFRRMFSASLSRLGLLAAVVTTLASCQKEEAAPGLLADYDTVAAATGHWEWESTTCFRFQATPASVGFTRQLIFKADSVLEVRRDQVLFGQTPYQRQGSSSALYICGQNAEQPFLVFAAPDTEPALRNNDRRTYLLREENGVRKLHLTGEKACVDAGSYETYRWVPAPSL